MRNIFSIKKDVYPLLKLAIPLAMTGLVQSAVWFFETLFLAHLGTRILAAGALVSWLFGTIAVILFGILSAINILVSHKHGEKNEEDIAFIARDGLIIAIFLSFLSSLLFWNMSPIFFLFDQPESTVSLAQSYLHALAFGLLPNFILIACMEVVVGIGHARIVLFFTILTVTLEIIGSYVLIFGKFGFPALGITGAGWGMTASYWISVFVLAFFMSVNKNYRNYFRYVFRWSTPSYLWELLQIGIPMGFMYCAEVAFFFALTLCMGLFGSEIQAANQIAMQYLGLFGSIMFAIAQAVTVRMGHLLGAKEIYAAEKVSLIGISAAFLISFILAMLYWFFPRYLIGIDFNLNNPSNINIARLIEGILLFSAIFQFVESIRIVLFGSLRALKDTKFTLMISIISFWFIALPLGYFIATRLKFGQAGFWSGMIVSAALSCILLQWRFKSKINRYYKME